MDVNFAEIVLTNYYHNAKVRVVQRDLKAPMFRILSNVVKGVIALIASAIKNYSMDLDDAHQNAKDAA